jgi:transcriptional regulator with XRE-family HTH domain
VKGCEPVTAKRDPDRSAMALFADELRAARDRAGLTQDELAARVNYSTTLIAMVEGLKRVPQADLAARLDDVLATPGTFGRLQERLRVLPFAASFRPFVAFEETATALRSFEHVLVPGLLQTEAYARAVLATVPNIAPDDLDELVASRLARQEILDRDDPPLLWAVLDEAVLHRPIGEDPKVMREQLGHLAEMAGRRNVTIEVIPYSAGGHIGLVGAFTVADFADSPSVAYLETAADGQTVEDVKTVTAVTLRFDTLRAEALPRRASRETILKVAEEQWT